MPKNSILLSMTFSCAVDHLFHPWCKRTISIFRAKYVLKNPFFSENKLTNGDASGFLRLYPNRPKVCIGNN